MVKEKQVYIENGVREPKAIRVLRVLGDGREVEAQYIESKKRVHIPVRKLHERSYADGFSLVENIL